MIYHVKCDDLKIKCDIVKKFGITQIFTTQVKIYSVVKNIMHLKSRDLLIRNSGQNYEFWPELYIQFF